MSSTDVFINQFWHWATFTSISSIFLPSDLSKNGEVFAIVLSVII